MNNKKFPTGFLFGGATAAYQVEGAVDIDGRGKNVWDDFYHRPESKFNADVACDFYHLYEKDILMAKGKGLNSIRISISWSRIFPDGKNNINEKGIKYYNDLIDSCNKHGLKPIVTLHHFDSPEWVVNQGDWLSKKTIDNFLRYAEVCFKEFGHKVKHFVTFNEPYVYNSDKYIFGECPPLEKGQVQKSIQSMYNMMVAHSKTIQLFRDMKINGEVGIVHVLQPKYPFDPKCPEDVKAAEVATSLYSSFMLELNYLGENTKKTLDHINELLIKYDGKLEINPEETESFKRTKNFTDFLGINYYNPTWFKAYDGPTIIEHNSEGQQGSSKLLLNGLGEAAIPDDIPRTDWDWAIYPKGLSDISLWIKDTYKNYKKIYITENGIGVKEDLNKDFKLMDEYRIEYINDHMSAVLDSIEHGVNIMGYFVWSLQDMFSWTNGYNKRYGLFFVDYENQKRFDKLSSYWFQDVIKNNTLNVDMISIKSKYLKS